MAYTIKGQAGKALDATSRTLGVDLVAVSGQLAFESMGMDRLSWTARTHDLAAGETILPETDQQVELYFSGTRVFRGWAAKPRGKNYGSVVEIEGPWRWLAKQMLTSARTSFTTTEDRPTFVFNEGKVEDHVTALLTRVIALGAPVAIGTIDADLTIAKQTLSNMSFASALVKLLAWVPDCVAWWDYSGTGTPTFNVTRRATMSATNYAAGTDELVDYDVTGRPDQVPARVELQYVDRSAAGLPLYAVQAAGTAVYGRTQVILISGAEGVPFVPQDDYESFLAQTVNANQTKDVLKPWLMLNMPEVQKSRNQFSGRPNPGELTLANGEIVTLTAGRPGTGTYTFPQPTLNFTDVETGAEVTRVGKHLLVSSFTTSAPPEWAVNVLANAERVKVTGRLYAFEESTLSNTAGTNTTEAPAAPDWQLAFPFGTTFLMNGWTPSFTLNGYEWARVNFLAYDFEFETYLTTASYPVLTTIYKPQDFEYLVPPAGLATALLAAQSVTPYEGHLILKPATAPALANVLTSLVNITGAQTEFATMDAMVKRVSYDLSSGYATRIELGPPGRFEIGGVNTRIKQSQQSIIEIN